MSRLSEYKRGCYIVVETARREDLCRAVLEIAHDRGFQWLDDTPPQGCKYLKAVSYQFCTVTGKIIWNDDPTWQPDSDYILMSPAEFAKVEKFNPPPPPITIRGEMVTFEANGDVKVGCETIPSEKVIQIIERRREAIKKHD